MLCGDPAAPVFTPLGYEAVEIADRRHAKRD
jgi:hypothetical protein